MFIWNMYLYIVLKEEIDDWCFENKDNANIVTSFTFFHCDDDEVVAIPNCCLRFIMVSIIQISSRFLPKKYVVAFIIP